MPQGTVHKLRAFSDFFGDVGPFVTGGVGTEVISFTVDEPGGILSLVTGGTDDNNAFIAAQGFKPADGPILMEARLKHADITLGSTNVGFTSQSTVLAGSTFVQPFEFATASLTTNDTNGAAFFYDIDATTDTYRFAAVGTNVDSAITVASAPVNDEFIVFRVEIDPTGDVRGFMNGSLVSSLTAAVSTTATYHGFVAAEARTGAAVTHEIDYLLVEGYRDWAV